MTRLNLNFNPTASIDAALDTSSVNNFLKSLTKTKGSPGIEWKGSHPKNNCHSDSSKPYSQLVIFGDSLSDPGNAFQLTGGLIPGGSPYFQGRFSNGPIWIDYLAPELGLGANQVTSFAVGGAKTGRDNALAAFYNLPPSIQLPGVLAQVDQYVAQVGLKGADPKALYVVWAGANDLFNLPPGEIGATLGITAAIANLSTAIGTLANLGAKKIVVPNSIDLGKAPGPARQGFSAGATAVSLAFNNALANTIPLLENTFGIDIIDVDLFSIAQRIFASPGEFGFTNITDPLFETQNPVHPDGYFWVDPIHPSTKVHQVVAQTFEAAVSKSSGQKFDPIADAQSLGAQPMLSIASQTPLSV